MAYVAVSGGEEAIAASLELLEKRRKDPNCAINVQTIVAALPELVDQVMSESSFYDKSLAALSLKQGGGSVEEAVFILRAFRSTLERPYTSRPINTSKMVVKRRISAAFKDIIGGQILGMTRDYSHRLLDFSLDDDKAITLSNPEENNQNAPSSQTNEYNLATQSQEGKAHSLDGFNEVPKISEYLHAQDLLKSFKNDDTPPQDLTMQALSFPAPRCIRLQALTRGMTQAVMALGYAAIRGFGPTHPTVGELRFGCVDILVDHPFKAGDESDAYYVGNIEITEVESLFPVDKTAPSDAHSTADDGSKEISNNRGDQEHSLELGIGYGLVYGSLESKAIAMSVLDFCLATNNPLYPTQDEEFVLYHIDGIEATGFISHLKLPHYVTFQSKLNSVRQTQEGQAQEALAQERSVKEALAQSSNVKSFEQTKVQTQGEK